MISHLIKTFDSERVRRMIQHSDTFRLMENQGRNAVDGSFEIVECERHTKKNPISGNLSTEKNILKNPD